LSITSLAITGTNASDFAEVADTCGSSLAAGSTCTIGVAFTPSATGQRTATLSITDNGSGGPQTASFTGTGTHDVFLSWEDDSNPPSEVQGYNVYRYQGTTAQWTSATRQNSTPIPPTSGKSYSYVDGNVTAGATYYYWVTTVGSDGVESAPSPPAEATVPTP
jgi:hypothetical protein